MNQIPGFSRPLRPRPPVARHARPRTQAATGPVAESARLPVARDQFPRPPTCRLRRAICTKGRRFPLRTRPAPNSTPELLPQRPARRNCRFLQGARHGDCAGTATVGNPHLRTTAPKRRTLEDDDSSSEPDRHRLHAVGCPELPANRVEVVLYGAQTDRESLGNVLTAKTMGRHYQAFALAGTQLLTVQMRCHRVVGDAAHEELMEVEAEQHDVAERLDNHLVAHLVIARQAG